MRKTLSIVYGALIMLLCATNTVAQHVNYMEFENTCSDKVVEVYLYDHFSVGLKSSFKLWPSEKKTLWLDGGLQGNYTMSIVFTPARTAQPIARSTARSAAHPIGKNVNNTNEVRKSWNTTPCYEAIDGRFTLIGKWIDGGKFTFTCEMHTTRA